MNDSELQILRDLGQDLVHGCDRVEQAVSGLRQSVELVLERFDGLESRVDQLEKQVRSLKGESSRAS